jgi:hypothetical protein
MSDHQLQ